MKRNENAVCGNCPYWQRTAEYSGDCWRFPSDSTYNGVPKTDSAYACGEHPQFFTDKPVIEFIAPSTSENP
jgi:hypothetical protein